MKWLLLLIPMLVVGGPDESRQRTIYHTLDPQSIAQNFAYYKLYPESDLGKRALKRSWELVNRHRESPLPMDKDFQVPDLDVTALIRFVNRQTFEEKTPLNERQLTCIEALSSHLPHRKLKGHNAWTVEELYTMEVEEIDLARSLLLYQFGADRLKIREYEAGLDLMALQILARLPKNAPSHKKLEAISNFIFHEKGFRFPPHSLHAKDIDLYTFLPSVLDSRLGVCLGVSIMYLSLAQRLELPLEIVTPPGHIYLTYQGEEGVTNIETTARGIHIPTKEYLGINTLSLQKRNLKEVIGLSFINQAAVMWERKKHDEAIELYEKALVFLPHDRLVRLFLGYNYLIIGEKSRGEAMLKEADKYTFGEVIYNDTMSEDYFSGLLSPEGIQIVFNHVDETRKSIIEKQKQLKEYVDKHPKFRDGIFQLAITWLQLSRTREALEVLERYHAIDQNNPTVEYYLTMLYLHRNNLPKAWEHFKRSQEIITPHVKDSHILRGLKNQLQLLSPEKGVSK